MLDGIMEQRHTDSEATKQNTTKTIPFSFRAVVSVIGRAC